MDNKEIQAKIIALEMTLTGNLMLDMDVKDKIHNLKMQLNGTKPSNTEIDCVGCGS